MFLIPRFYTFKDKLIGIISKIITSTTIFIYIFSTIYIGIVAYIYFIIFITPLLSRDTPMTPYTCLPISTDSAIRDRSRDCRNLRQSTAICYILPCSAIFCLPVSTAVSAISATSITSAEFCQVLPGP